MADILLTSSETFVSLTTFLLSVLLFFILDRLLLFFGAPKRLFLNNNHASKHSSDDYNGQLSEHSAVITFWKFRNISLSFLHAFSVSIWLIIILYHQPHILEDLIYTYSLISLSLICFSVGYFVHDSLQMLYYSKTAESLELLGHHLVIFICFGIAIVWRIYIGYAVVALFIEINSIFLHLRQLLRFLGMSKSHTVYRVNCLLNIATYVLFRVATLAWMTRWLVANRNRIPLAMCSVGGLGLAVINIMNIVLLYRLICSDFFSRNKTNKTSKSE